MPEALWFESGRDGRLDAAIVLELLLCRRNVAERLEETPMIEPVDPRKRREFVGFKSAPWPFMSDKLLVQADNVLSECVVVVVADATDGRLNSASSRFARGGRSSGSRSCAFCLWYVDGSIGSTAQIGPTPNRSLC